MQDEMHCLPEMLITQYKEKTRTGRWYEVTKEMRFAKKTNDNKAGIKRKMYEKRGETRSLKSMINAVPCLVV